MKVSSVSLLQHPNYRQTITRQNPSHKPAVINCETCGQPAFHGFSGKLAGGIIGGGIAGIIAIASMATPIGWAAAATLLVSEAGGAIVCSKIGDKISKDDD